MSVTDLGSRTGRFGSPRNIRPFSTSSGVLATGRERRLCDGGPLSAVSGDRHPRPALLSTASGPQMVGEAVRTALQSIEVLNRHAADIAAGFRANESRERAARSEGPPSWHGHAGAAGRPLGPGHGRRPVLAPTAPTASAESETRAVVDQLMAQLLAQDWTAVARTLDEDFIAALDHWRGRHRRDRRHAVVVSGTRGVKTAVQPAARGSGRQARGSGLEARGEELPVSDRKPQASSLKPPAVPFSPPQIGDGGDRRGGRDARVGLALDRTARPPFEAEFAEFIGAPAAVAVNSCTAGAASLARRRRASGPATKSSRRRSRSARPPTSSCTAARRRCSPTSIRTPGNLDPRAAAAAITPRTRAIIPVHYGGRPADVAAFSELARRHGLVTIEDAAHCVEGVARRPQDRHDRRLHLFQLLRDEEPHDR